MLIFGKEREREEGGKDPLLFESVSSPEEFHPQALTEPDVAVSRHPAIIDESNSGLTLPKGSSFAMQS